jgi:sugar O-acyltransferase (sialic acid O-acetyltransferase NeuD family)
MSRRGTPIVFADENLPLGSRVGSAEIRFAHLSDLAGQMLLITIGDNARREMIQQEALSMGLELTSFVADPANYFADPPGPGSVVLAGAVVNVGTVIGPGAIVNSSAVVEHDCRLGAYVHVSSGAQIAGDCEIGNGAWIGAGATVIPQLVIAGRTVIGAGSTVTRSISEPGVYVGSPARRIR